MIIARIGLGPASDGSLRIYTRTDGARGEVGRSKVS